MANIGCTPAHPGYIGQLPPDAQDAAFINIVSQVPYIGSIASAFMAAGFRGGAACYEDKTRNFRTGWTKEITAGIVALILIGIAIWLVV